MCFHALHLCPDMRDLTHIHRILSQSVFLKQRSKRISVKGMVDNLPHFSTDVRIFPVPDRFDQKFSQRTIVERDLTQNIENPAIQFSTFPLQLFKQTLKNCTLSGLF